MGRKPYTRYGREFKLDAVRQAALAFEAMQIAQLPCPRHLGTIIAYVIILQDFYLFYGRN